MALRNPRNAALAAAAVAIAAVVGLVLALGGDDGERSEEPRTKAEKLEQIGVERPLPRRNDGRPNIVVVVTDDQEEASMRVMPRTRRLIGRRGVTFPESITNLPLCCPSRATYQSGQYAHNHRVLDNRPPKGGFGRFDTSSTIATWMSEAGYDTAYIGKYLNGYGQEDPEFVPPGWATWEAMVAPVTRYFNFRLNENGRVKRFGENEKDYVTDVLTSKAVRYLRRQKDARRPFFLTVAHLAPHVGKSGKVYEGTGHCKRKGPGPAPRHFRDFEGTEIPRGPAFNEDDVSDKPRAIRELPKVRGEKLAKKTDKYQCRLETLPSVDEGVEEIVATLREEGLLDDTYVIFTSDNGFVQGEHRLKGGKGEIYEESLLVPLLVRGPGVPAGRTARELVVNADLPATFLDIADAEPGLPQDGRSLLRVLRDPGFDRERTILIESLTYTGVRTHAYTYVEHESGERELYDLPCDPHQLDNVADRPAYAGAQRSLARELDRLRDCAGASCRGVGRGATPPPSRC